MTYENKHESIDDNVVTRSCSEISGTRNTSMKNKSHASLHILHTDTFEEKEKANHGMHAWTRRHFWALHILTFLLAVSCSWSLLFWINLESGISRNHKTVESNDK